MELSRRIPNPPVLSESPKGSRVRVVVTCGVCVVGHSLVGFPAKEGTRATPLLGFSGKPDAECRGLNKTDSKAGTGTQRPYHRQQDCFLDTLLSQLCQCWVWMFAGFFYISSVHVHGHMEARGQLSGVSTLVPSCGFRVSNSS